MIYLEKKHMDIVLQILKKYSYNFYAYGSRVTGEQRATSDLDICFTDAIPYNVQAHIEEDFEESDLPFRVDIVDLNLVTDDFRRSIMNHMVLIKK